MIHNSGTNRALSTGLMQQAVAKSEVDGDGEISLVVCDHDMWITYGNLMAPNQRFQDLIKKMDGGFRYLDFMGIPVVPDKDCDSNKMFFCDMSVLELLEHGDYDWMDLDGSIIKWNAGYDQWQAVLVKDMNLGCGNCNRQVVLKDIANNLN